jgi:hypothetical protein
MTGTQWHRWTRWVLGSDSLTDAQKLVLLALQTFADYPAGTNARPGVATLAVACGLKERAVRYALEAGERLKLIEQTKPANPKRGHAATYRLISSGTAIPVESVSSGTRVPVENGSSGTAMQFQVARSDTSSGTGVPPTYSDRLNKSSVWSPEPGTSSREPHQPGDDAQTSQQSADSNGAHPERPSEFCPRHPGGTTKRCGDCANHRRAAEAWDRARAEEADLAALARANERQFELDRLAMCTDCDPVGWLLDPNTREPVEPAIKCDHPKLTGRTSQAAASTEALILADRLVDAVEELRGRNGRPKARR